MDQQPNGPGGVDADRLRDVQSWRRSRSDRMIAGVCGGVGRALNIDPVLIRVVIAVLTIAGGAGIPIYIAAWLLMPEEGADSTPAQDMFGRRARPDHPWLWPVVIAIGIFCAVGISSSLKIWPFSFPGPLIAVIAIWFFLARRKNQRRQMHEHSHWGGHWSDQAPTATPAGTTPPAGPSYPAGPASSATQSPPDRPQDRPQDSATVSAEPAAAGESVWTEDDPLGLYVDDEPAPAPTSAAARPAPYRRNPWVKPVVTLAAAAAIGIALLAGAALPMALAIGLLTLGAGMLLGAFAGRTRGLMLLALPLALAVGATSTFTTIPDFGDLQVAPTGPIGPANPAYEIGVGSMRIDLTKATFQPGATVRAHAEVGEITLVLPPNVDVVGKAAAHVGELNVFGQRTDGHKPALTIDDLGQDQKASPQKVTLDIGLKLGTIVVERG